MFPLSSLSALSKDPVTRKPSLTTLEYWWFRATSKIFWMRGTDFINMAGWKPVLERNSLLMMANEFNRGSGPFELVDSAEAFSSSGKIWSKCASIANLRVAVKFARVLRQATLTFKFLF